MVSKRIAVSPEDRVELERIVRSRRAERRMVERAGVVLAAAEGLPARRPSAVAVGPQPVDRAEVDQRVARAQNQADFQARSHNRYYRVGIMNTLR